MHLALDIGNSAIKGALFEGADPDHVFRIPHAGACAEGDLLPVLREHLAGQALSGAGIASVVPALTEPVAGVVRGLAGITPVQVNAGMSLPFALGYDTPQTLGADRIAAAAAAWLLFGKAGGSNRSVVVIDAGTAVTVEVVERSGRYLGGTIAPGPGLALASLRRGTAQLPDVPLELPDRVIGRSTQEAMQSGLIYGFLDSVRGLLHRVRASLPDEPVVVATGGWSDLLRAQLPEIDYADPHLVLRGVRLLTAG